MNTFWLNFCGLLPMLVGGAVPFALALRGVKPLRSFLIGWASIVLSFIFFTVVIPLTVAHFDRDQHLHMGDWFAEPPIVIGMVFFGWFYSGIFLGLGGLLRFTRNKLRTYGNPKEA